MELTERKSKILSSVVDHFIAWGEPVGSKTIAEQIGVSSATIRNEMAELIRLGLLEQPHTSSGRVPSPKGYRQYLEDGLPGEPLTQDEKRYLDAILQKRADDPGLLLEGVSRLLGGYTKSVSIVSAPSEGIANISAVQFVQISRRTAMLVLVTSVGTVRSRLFHCDYDLTSEILRVFFRVFNGRMVGTAIADINPAFIQSMALSLESLAMLSAPPLMALLEAAQEMFQSKLLIDGQINLMMCPELEFTDLREIYRFLEDSEAVKGLLSEARHHATAWIGPEIGLQALNETAVVMIKYRVNRQDLGTLAVLGPMRMDYKKNFQVLSYLSEQVGMILTNLMTEP